MKKIFSIYGVALAGLFALLTASEASACRDCPFPMKVGANEWIMPNSTVLLSIYETKAPSGLYRTSVVLQEQYTGMILAEGMAWRRPDQRELKITLLDSNKRRIRGVIYWTKFSEPVIKAKFTCIDAGCVIARRL